MFEIIAAVLGLVLLVDLWLWLRFPNVPPKRGQDVLPALNILVAVRNEAHNVEQLIAHLSDLDYPADLLQILIGDDGSSDLTLTKLKELVSNDQRFKLVDIDPQGPLVGKARVIAQLVGHANAPYMLITDADVRVPTTWAREMVAHLQPDLGVWGGCTAVVGDSLWSKLQNMDWMLAQGMLLSAQRSYKTLAVSGTNMGISREACEAIGGYDQIPYPLTEDIGFLTAAGKSGFTAQLIFNPRACAKIPPQENWSTLIKQRARWTYGALKLPGVVVLMLTLRAIAVPLMIGISLLNPLVALVAYLLRQIIQWGIINKTAKSLDQTTSLMSFMVFEVYYSLVTLGGLILYLLPIKITWKNRRYL